MNTAIRRILRRERMPMKRWREAAAGFLIGLCNALLGAGGGLLAVP